MRALAISVLAFSAAGLQAQGMGQVGKVTLRYDVARRSVTEPPFGLDKVKKLLANLKGSDENVDAIRGPFSKKFLGLSFEEQFTYTMIHGEQFNQGCSMMPILEHEEHKIFAYPATFDTMGNTWSDRQINFLLANRRQVIPLLRSTIETRHQVGSNLKQAVLVLDAHEVIPDMIAAYEEGHEKDQDILSTCMALMREGKYKPFLTTKACATLYGPRANYQSYLNADAATKRLVMQEAMAFSRS